MPTNSTEIATSSALALDASANTSAVDLSDMSALELPHRPTGERVRRRSELARARPPALEPESIELAAIPESAGGATPSVKFRADPLDDVDVDVEVAPSFPSSLVPSVRYADETGSTASLSPAQRRVHERRVLVNFATVCLRIFMEGWNDGTTGPLLHRIQEYYGVSALGRMLGRSAVAPLTLCRRSDTRSFL